MTKYWRKIITVQATDSPNVRLAMAESGAIPAHDTNGNITGFTYARGKPSGRTLLPGVLTWGEFLKRLSTWDPIRAHIGLWARFYFGAEVLLYPPQWLDRANRLAAALRGKPRKAKSIGIDPGEGAANTAWAVIDDLGLIELLAYPTPDTSVIPSTTIALGKKYGVDAKFWVFDRGGGGYEHANTLRSMGYREVRSIGFGEGVSIEPKRGNTVFDERLEVREERYAYVNRRAQMYGLLRERLDPATLDARGNPIEGFALPGPEAGPPYALLRNELAPIPLLYDREGRLRLLPKNKRDPTSEERTLTELIGHSPDEADALVLALYGMTYTLQQRTAGSIG